MTGPHTTHARVRDRLHDAIASLTQAQDDVARAADCLTGDRDYDVHQDALIDEANKIERIKQELETWLANWMEI